MSNKTENEETTETTQESSASKSVGRSSTKHKCAECGSDYLKIKKYTLICPECRNKAEMAAAEIKPTCAAPLKIDIKPRLKLELRPIEINAPLNTTAKMYYD